MRNHICVFCGSPASILKPIRKKEGIGISTQLLKNTVRIVEPSGYMVEPSGYTVCEMLATKRNGDDLHELAGNGSRNGVPSPFVLIMHVFHLI